MLLLTVTLIYKIITIKIYIYITTGKSREVTGGAFESAPLCPTAAHASATEYNNFSIVRKCGRNSIWLL